MAQMVGYPPDCLACGLYRGCKTFQMEGQGPVPCDVLIVGEAPGATEDELGTPFRGRSGKLLDDLLDGIDIDRANLRITNAVRCHPPNNATPTPEQVRFCHPHLQMEIEQVKPKLILTLGAIAANAVLGGRQALAKLRGTMHQRGTAKVVCTYHPAYALRNPSATETIAMDLALGFSLLDSRADRGKIVLIRSQAALDRLTGLLSKHRGLLAFDIEGNSKNPFRANYRLPCYSIAVSPSLSFCIPADHQENVWLDEAQYLRPLQAIRDNPHARLVMHNCYYDLIGTLNRFNLHLPNGIEDTILMYALLDENAKHDLDSVTALFCPELAGYSADVNHLLDEGTQDFSKIPLATLWRYNAYDSLATYRAYAAMKPKVVEKGLAWVYRHVMIDGIQQLRRIGLSGLSMNLELVRETDVKYAKRLREIHEQLLGLPAVRKAMEIWAEHRKKTSKHKTDFPLSRYVEPFNPGSPQQKRILLFDVYGAKPLSATEKTGLPSVDDETIEKYARKYKAVQLLRDYTKLKKCHGTYVAPVEQTWLNSFDGRSHSTYKLHVARTGRTCVAKGTIINGMPCGKPIEQVQPGDKVFSLVDGKPVLSTVVCQAKTGFKPVVKIHWYRKLDTRNYYLYVTADHLIRLPSGEYKAAGSLERGDPLVLHYGEGVVHGVKKIPGRKTVYDLEVDNDCHNFFAAGVCVHNSSSGPNHENVPRVDTNPDIKRFFVAEPGYAFVQADYSQMELRVLACYSKDEELLRCYREGLDVHRLLASYYYRIPVNEITKAQRSAAKSTNFGVIYGQGPVALANDLGISVKEADGLISSYFRKFSGVRRWMEQTKAFAHKHGYVRSAIGRIRHLPEIVNGQEASRKEAERQAVNSPIQGLASDMLLLRLKALYHLIDTSFPTVTIRAVVHDSALFQVPIDQVTAFAKAAKPVMEDFSMFEWCIVPILTEWESGPNWGELKSLEL